MGWPALQSYRFASVFETVKSALTDGLKSEMALWVWYAPPQTCSKWLFLVLWYKGLRLDNDLYAAWENGLLRNDGGRLLQLSSLKTLIYKICSGCKSKNMIKSMSFWIWTGVLKKVTELAVHFATFKAGSIFTLTACKCIFFSMGKDTCAC